MIKIAKYEFVDEQQAKDKIKGLGVDKDGNPTHHHAIVELGNVILQEGETDAEGNEITPPKLSEKYHIDVMWVGLEEHPYGWKSYAVTPSDEGLHSFYGVDYLTNKM